MNRSNNRRLVPAIAWACLSLATASLLQTELEAAASRRVPTEVQSAVCRVFNQTSGKQDIGSGTLVDKTADGRQGLVLTCYHLFRDGTGNIVVEFSDGRKHGAKLVHADPQADLAALVIANPKPNPVSLQINSGRQPAAGSRQPFYACGYGPHGQFRCAVGPIVGESQAAGQQSLTLQGAVRSGDSGGGVFDQQGRLAGVVWGESQGITYASCGGPLRRFLDRVLGRQAAVGGGCAGGVCPVQPVGPGSGTTRLAAGRMEKLERQVAQLRQQKQDRGDYITRENLQRIESISATRHESLLDRIRSLSSGSGTGIGRAAGTAAVGLLGISGPAGWAVIAAGSLGGWLIGRGIKKRRGAGGRRSPGFRRPSNRTQAT